jgi:transcriptional regulator with XRE-family HTH domain
MSKKAEKEQAMALRKRGFSYKEIARYTNVSVSTVSLWFKDTAWSKEIAHANQKRAARENSKRISLLNKARTNQFTKLYGEAERSAITEYKHYKHNPLFIAGIMLYFAQGGMRDERLIRLSNANPEIHRIFIAFLTEFLGVPREKVRFWLLLYPTHNPERVSKVWAKKLRLPLSQFHKYQVIERSNAKRVLQYGVGNTIIGSAVLKRKLATWVEIAIKELK